MSPAEKVAVKSNTSLPKNLFGSNEEQQNTDDLDQRKSPIITYKRRVPASRNSQLKSEKRLKPSSPLKLFNSQLVAGTSSCSTPISEKSKPLPLVIQSPIVCSMESEEEDSLLFEFCDKIEKSVRQDGSLVAKLPEQKNASTSSCVAAGSSRILEKKKAEISSRVNTGFSTASGTQIPLSEDAVKNSERLLSWYLAQTISDCITDDCLFD